MPTRHPAWQALERHFQTIRDQHMRDWFDCPGADVSSVDPSPRAPNRAERFTLQAAGLTLDYAKNRISDETLSLLILLAEQAGLASKREAMFAGEILNFTEQRAVLHVALRDSSTDPLLVKGENVRPIVQDVLARMKQFVDQVRNGIWQGANGHAITDVVNIGIGGSDLGPRMVCRAFSHLPEAYLRTHFVANVDGFELASVLNRLRADSTLLVISSKTFTTQETMANAHAARAWLLEQGIPETALHRHMVAVSSNQQAATAFGVATENVFGYRDWVGGRFSLWSPVGLPIALQLGFARFQELLDGAAAMDAHFRHAPLAQNMPVLLALLGIWYRNFFHAPSLCIAPYAQALEYLPGWLQQLDMESNGKSVGTDGLPVRCDTAPVIWGQPGTNGQHAFFQMIHQGTQLIPVDFIAVREPMSRFSEQHAKLLANCFAQGEALMRGRTAEQTLAAQQGHAPWLPFQVFQGNRPSNTLLLQKLDPTSLGALLALYEHKIFVQSVIWNINAFDQWGVELGKQLAAPIVAELQGGVCQPHDSSTAQLIQRALP